jgi:hypothetical protein
MSDYSTSYASDTALVQESVTLNVTDIVSSDIDYTETSPFFNTAAKSSILTATFPENAGPST